MNLIGRVSSILVMAFSAYFAYCVFLDGRVFNHPITHWEGSLNPVKNSYAAGEEFSYRLVFTKHRECSGEINLNLVNVDSGEVYRYSSRPSSFDPGFYDIVVYPITIPACATSGRYVLQGNVAYFVNAFSTVLVKVKTGEFNVHSERACE